MYSAVKILTSALNEAETTKLNLIETVARYEKLLANAKFSVEENKKNIVGLKAALKKLGRTE